MDPGGIFQKPMGRQRLFRRKKTAVSLGQSCTKKRHQREIGYFGKFIVLHGGALDDFGSGLTQRSFEPQLGQI